MGRVTFILFPTLVFCLQDFFFYYHFLFHNLVLGTYLLTDEGQEENSHIKNLFHNCQDY